jgi:hypothetical protein
LEILNKKGEIFKAKKEYVDNLSESISIKETEFIIKKILKRKASGFIIFTNSTKHLRKKSYQVSTISPRK